MVHILCAYKENGNAGELRASSDPSTLLHRTKNQRPEFSASISPSYLVSLSSPPATPHLWSLWLAEWPVSDGHHLHLTIFASTCEYNLFKYGNDKAHGPLVERKMLLSTIYLPSGLVGDNPMQDWDPDPSFMMETVILQRRCIRCDKQICFVLRISH